MGWWTRKAPLLGLALFAHEPAKPAVLASLAEAGIHAEPLAAADAIWKLRLTHPDWGAATLSDRGPESLPPRLILEHSFGLTDDERKEIGQVKGALLLEMDGGGNVLRDRKLMLRFLDAAIAKDGLAAMDMLAQKIWSRDALADELAHDADLDVEAIFVLHAVNDGRSGAPRCRWLHSHGLGEVGGFDFDVLDPSPELLTASGSDFFRALAFAILEESVTSTTASYTAAYPGGEIAFVEAEDFTQRGDPAYALQVRDPRDEAHRRRRAVLCEPDGWFFTRWFRKGLIPSRFLSGSGFDRCVLPFTRKATDLTAARAKKTYGVLRKLAEELEPMQCPKLVKLGYPIDGEDDNREHMWFEVNGFDGDSIDATLVNEPRRVAKMHAGDRARHPLSVLSDWIVITPAGMLNPRSLMNLRTLRAHWDEIMAKVQAPRP